MTTTIDGLKVNFVGDATSLSKSVVELQKGLAAAGVSVGKLDVNLTAQKKTASEHESALVKLGGGFNKLGLGAEIGLAGAGAEMMHFAHNLETSEADLKTAVENSGHSFEELEGKLGPLNSKMEKFGHTNADTEEALSKLTVATQDPNKALADMTVVADLAARKHISLSDAAGMVAKAYGGSGRAFKDFGVELQKGGDKVANADKALGELEKRIGGTAQAQADTFGGKIKAIGTWGEDMAAKIGAKAGPALFAFGGIASTVGSIAESKLGQGLKSAVAAIGGVGPAVGIGVTALVAGGFILSSFAAAHQKTAALVQEFVTAMHDEATGTQGTVDALIARKAAEEGLFQAMEKRGISEKTVISAIHGDVEATNQVHKAIYDSHSDIGQLMGEVDGLGGAYRSAASQQDAVATGTAAVTGALEKVSGAADGLTKSLDENVKKYDAVWNATHRGQNKMQDLIGTIQSSVAANEAHTKALTDQQKATDDLDKAQDAYNKTVDQYGPTSDEAASKADALRAAQDKLASTTTQVDSTAWGAVKALSAQDQAMVDFGVTLLKTGTPLDSVIGQIDDLARRSGASEGDISRMNDQMRNAAGTAVEKAGDFQAYIDKVAELEAHGWTAADAMYHLQHTAQDAASALNNAAAGIGGVGAYKQGYASGTASATAGWHPVGEKGMEWVKFAGGETVLPNGQAPDISAVGGSPGGGRGDVYNTIQVFGGAGQSPAAIADETMRAIRRGTRMPG